MTCRPAGMPLLVHGLLAFLMLLGSYGVDRLWTGYEHRRNSTGTGRPGNDSEHVG
jgi:hypothetical protein